MKRCIFILLFFACSCSSDNGDPNPTPTSDSGDDVTADTKSGDVGGDEDMGNDTATGTDASDNDTDDVEDMGPILRDEELLAALRNDADATMNPLGYNTARDNMYTFGGTEDQNGRIECVYTGRTVDTDTSRTPSQNCELADGSSTNCQFNTEHTVPRLALRNALGDGSPLYNDAEGDLHHLFPSDEDVNGARGNFEFGDTDCDTENNCRYDEESLLGLRLGAAGSPTCPGDAPCVMEVRQERRGDVARAVFYMSMRYAINVSPNAEATLRIWHTEDPVGEYERNRNGLAERAQRNRNPFVDSPELVDRISNF